MSSGNGSAKAVSTDSFHAVLLHSIRELAYPSTKASLVHTYTRDTRDDAWTGSRGSLVKVSHVSFLFLFASRRARIGQRLIPFHSFTGTCRSARQFSFGKLFQEYRPNATFEDDLARVRMGEALSPVSSARIP